MHFLSKPIPRRASCCGGLRYSGGLNGGSDGDRDGGGGERERQTQRPLLTELSGWVCPRAQSHQMHKLTAPDSELLESPHR